MLRTPFFTLLLSTLLLTFSACEKEEGEGGKALITGRVKTLEYSDAGNVVGEYYKSEQRVYIIYGDGTAVDDDTRSSYDGSYRFEYLRKGNYTLYAISDCDTCLSGERAVFQSVTISERDQVFEVPDLVIEER